MTTDADAEPPTGATRSVLPVGTRVWVDAARIQRARREWLGVQVDADPEPHWRPAVIAAVLSQYRYRLAWVETEGWVRCAGGVGAEAYQG